MTIGRPFISLAAKRGRLGRVGLPRVVTLSGTFAPNYQPQ